MCILAWKVSSIQNYQVEYKEVKKSIKNDGVEQFCWWSNLDGELENGDDYRNLLMTSTAAAAFLQSNVWALRNLYPI